jgi:hypothetical protein
VLGLILTVALCLFAPETGRAQAAPDDRGQSVVQHSPLTATFLPPRANEPCVRKPAGSGSLKLIGFAAACSTCKAESVSAAFLSPASGIAISLSPRGGERAPPVRELI